MVMSIPYHVLGRARQKQRTRDALVEAARSLILSGRTPTVEEAAASAGISRTTAYRYFGNQAGLLVAAYPSVATSSLLGSKPTAAVETRLDQVVSEILRLTLESESVLRAMLRLSLESDSAQREKLYLRRGRAIGWLSDALAPLRGQLANRDLERLVYAIRAAAGIEALVWLTDVAGLSRQKAVELMRWSARALLRSARAEARQRRSRQK